MRFWNSNPLEQKSGALGGNVFPTQNVGGTASQDSLLSLVFTWMFGLGFGLNREVARRVLGGAPVAASLKVNQ